MQKEVVWYALLFLINAIFITVCITYVQTTLYTSFTSEEEKLAEIEHKLSLITMMITAAKEEEKATQLQQQQQQQQQQHNQLEEMGEQMKEGQNIVNELYEYVLDITRTVHETAEQILFLGQQSNLLHSSFSLFTQQLSSNINNISNNKNNKNNDNNNNNNISSKNGEMKEEKTEKGGKVKVRWEEFKPLKDNKRSYSTNAHKVIKSHPDWHSFEGEYTNSFLRSFVKQNNYNFTITSFERVDVYYHSDELSPNGFSYFMDVKVNEYYECIERENQNELMKKMVASLRENADGNKKVHICSNCKLIIQANILTDFHPTHIGNHENDVAMVMSDVEGEIVLPRSNIRVSVYDPSPRVNFISPIYNVGEEFKRMLGYLEEMYKKDKNIRWIVCDFMSDDIDVKKLLAESHLPHIYLTDEGKFSRVRGLNAGADAVEDKNEILFFLDVDMYFLNDFSHVIRSRTIQGEQVFYPICYSYYSNGKPPAYTSGYYREGGLGNVGMYKSDFELNRWAKNGNTETWGNEDNVMFDKISKKYVAYRSYEPQYFHLYHSQRAWHPKT